MDGRVKISVVTPSFNQANFIERTLQSVAMQKTDFAFEHVVVDGGSTDGTLDILARHSGSLRFVSGPDRGMPDAVNKGFAMTTGEIIGWLNSDDLYEPGALQKVAGYLDRHPECLWLYGKCKMIDARDRETRRWITAYKNRSAGRFSMSRLLVENFISQPAVFFRREMLDRAGLLDIGLPTAMDYDLWLRFARESPPGFIDEYLASFRVHPGSISSRTFREQFDEQYRIHLRYDQTPALLARHRTRIRQIVFVYSFLNFAASIGRRK